MKKFLTVLVIAAMVVLDLILSGTNVAAGLLIISAVGFVSFLLDSVGSQKKRYNDVTHAARQSQQQRSCSEHSVRSVAA